MLAHFRWENCPHDIHSYWDFQIKYDRDAIEDMENNPSCTLMGDDNDMFDRFWRWVNHCESAMGDDEEQLLKWCEQLFQKEIKMDVIHNAINEEYNGLKAV